MKKLIILFPLLFVFVCLIGQVPFSTYTPSPNKAVARHFLQTGKIITSENDVKINALENEVSALTGEAKKEEKKLKEQQITLARIEKRKKIYALADEELSKADFLDHMNANITTIQNGKKMFPTINGEVINYKLSLWTSYIIKEKDGIKDSIKRRHLLPISLFTKISGNYSDSTAGPTDDATSYFGAPLTLRFAPAFELLPGKTRENKLFVGLNTDLRLLTIGDTIKNKLQTTWGVYGSAGITYLGRGYAYDGEDDTDESGRYDGKWSFTAMFYLFKSGGEYNKAIFGDYEGKTLSGVELLLRFKTNKKEDSKFNFLIGASNSFTKGVPNTGNWQFRLGIGN